MPRTLSSSTKSPYNPHRKKKNNQHEIKNKYDPSNAQGKKAIKSTMNQIRQVQCSGDKGCTIRYSGGGHGSFGQVILVFLLLSRANFFLFFPSPKVAKVFLHFYVFSTIELSGSRCFFFTHQLGKCSFFSLIRWAIYF